MTRRWWFAILVATTGFASLLAFAPGADSGASARSASTAVAGHRGTVREGAVLVTASPRMRMADASRHAPSSGLLAPLAALLLALCGGAVVGARRSTGLTWSARARPRGPPLLQYVS